MQRRLPTAILVAMLAMFFVAEDATAAKVETGAGLDLAAGYDSRSAARLVKSNWVRTIAWTLRGIIALLLLPLGAST